VLAVLADFGVGRRDDDATLARVAPLLDVAQARPVLIDVIGGLRSQAGLPLLERVMREPVLSEDETVRLACALGEVSGEGARELLIVLRGRFTDPPAAVAQEIDIALQAIERS